MFLMCPSKHLLNGPGKNYISQGEEKYSSYYFSENIYCQPINADNNELKL